MAKKFSELRDKMPAHARELAHQKAQDELARLNQPLEPDLVDWLKAQNDDIKHYVNDMGAWRDECAKASITGRLTGNDTLYRR